MNKQQHPKRRFIQKYNQEKLRYICSDCKVKHNDEYVCTSCWYRYCAACIDHRLTDVFVDSKFEDPETGREYTYSRNSCWCKNCTHHYFYCNDNKQP